jgi:hypothetical protein
MNGYNEKCESKDLSFHSKPPRIKLEKKDLPADPSTAQISGKRNAPVTKTVRVARWFLFKLKIPIWVNFGGP